MNCFSASANWNFSRAAFANKQEAGAAGATLWSTARVINTTPAASSMSMSSGATLTLPRPYPGPRGRGNPPRPAALRRFDRHPQDSGVPRAGRASRAIRGDATTPWPVAGRMAVQPP